MTEVFSLESEICLDVSVAGAKAARLAEALQRGLPVLPGFVIPVITSVQLLNEAAEESPSEGVHSARFRVMESTLPNLSNLNRTFPFLSNDVIVRSSSPLEDSAEFSGAFTSYLGVHFDEIETAIRGVWASAITEDAVDETNKDRKIEMAVLVQPEIEPQWSGTAQVYDTNVTVVAVEGSSAALMAGWARGNTTHLSRIEDGSLQRDGDEAEQLLNDVWIQRVGNLALDVLDTLNNDLIEWAVVNDDVILLQAKTAGSHEESSTELRSTGEDIPAETATVAFLAYTFAGPLGEEIVTPVILAGVTTDLPKFNHLRSNTSKSQRATSEGWEKIQTLSYHLQLASWGVNSEDALDPAGVLAELRGGSIVDGVERLRSLNPPPELELQELLAATSMMSTDLVNRSLLLHQEDFWGLTVADVDAITSGQLELSTSDFALRAQEGRRRMLMRWEPFVHTAVMETGTLVNGESVCNGVGAGRVVFVEGLPSSVVSIPRMILIAPNPIPQLAPLLWGAAGLVTFGGSEAAHLVEVARSVGVPTILGCSEETLRPLVSDNSSPLLAAVDGTSGAVGIGTRGANR